MSEIWIANFVAESNWIEGIHRNPTQQELDVHIAFVTLRSLSVADLELFVSVVAPGKLLREKPGMNVFVGNHRPPPGGPNIRRNLEKLLAPSSLSRSAYEVHCDYETLHPFIDGNGRSGRALWLWMMLRNGSDWPEKLGFLHSWYYQSLAAIPIRPTTLTIEEKDNGTASK